MACDGLVRAARRGQAAAGPRQSPCGRCAPPARRAARPRARSRPAGRPGPASARCGRAPSRPVPPRRARAGDGAVGGRDRPQHLRARGEIGRADHVADGGFRPGQRGQPDRRGEPELAPLGQFSLGVRHRVPAHQRLHRRERRVGHDHDGTSLAPGPHQRGGVEPAAQRLLGRAQAGAAEQRPAVQQDSRRVASRRAGLGSRGRHDDRGRAVHLGDDLRAAGGPDGGGGERAGQLLRGAAGPDDQRAQPGLPAARAPRARGLAAPAAHGRRPCRGQGQRAAAPRAAGPRAAAFAGHGDHVAPAGHLEQDRPAGEPLARGAQGQAGHARRAGGLVPGQLRVIAGHGDPRRPPADRVPPGGEGGGPAAGHQLGHLGRPREAAQQRGRAAAVRAEREHLPGVRVRRPRLGVQVVAVVPDHDQSEVGDGGEHRGPGPGGHADLAPGDPEPAPVPLGGTEARRETDVLAGPEQAGQRGVDQAEVPGVGDDDQRPAPGGAGGGGRPPDLVGPVRAGQGGPGRARRAPRGQRGEERPARRVAGPGARLGERNPGLAVPRRPAARCRRLGRGVARRDRQPQHVGQRAAVPVGHRAGQPGDLGRQHRLRRHDPLQEGQRALMLARLGPPQQVAAGQPAGEPDPDPAAGYRVRREPLGHQVVEGPVQVRQRHVDGHLRHGQAVGRRLHAAPRCPAPRCHGVCPTRDRRRGRPFRAARWRGRPTPGTTARSGGCRPRG